MSSTNSTSSGKSASKQQQQQDNNKKSAKKTYAQCPPIQLVIRDGKGWRLYKQHHKTGKLQIESATKPCTDADIIFSTDGEYFAVLLEQGIEIYESAKGRKISFLSHYRVRNVYFSPLNSFIISYHHRRPDDKNGNCWVWKWNKTDSEKANDEASNVKDADIKNKDNDDMDESKQQNHAKSSKVIYQFFLPEFDKKRVPLQFTNDEFIAARITKNAVVVHDVLRLSYRSNNIIGKVDIANANSVVVAPTRRPMKNKESTPQNSYILAIFALPKNNKAATVGIYEFQYNLAMNKKSKTNKLFSRISQRAFYGVDTCELLWDDCTTYHHNLLAIASSDVDTSGKSYYGNQTVYLLSSRNSQNVKIPISEKGKLQDVKWHPNGKEFVMIDDHPQKISIFDFRGNLVKNLGNYARNLIRFSRDGKFLWCGGFGNLTGEMTFYDYGEIKKNAAQCLGYGHDDACRYFEWSPDSSSLVTARLYPYMTVDNGFRIYKYNGHKLYEEKFDRLYQIAYRPNLRGVYPPRSASPSASKKSRALPKKGDKKGYVPPHLRNKRKDGRQKQVLPNNYPQQSSQQPAQQQKQKQVLPNNYPSQKAKAAQVLPNNYNLGFNAPSQTPQQQQQPSASQQQQYGQSQGQYGGRGRGRGRGGGGGHYQQGQHYDYYNNGNYAQHHNGGNQYNQYNQNGHYQQYGHVPQQQQYAQNNQNVPQQQMQNMNMNVTASQQPQAQVQQGQVQSPNEGGIPIQNDGNGAVKKRRRRRSRNKNNSSNPVQGANNGANSGGNGGWKPGLADNDKSRWARGSKYTE